MRKLLAVTAILCSISCVGCGNDLQSRLDARYEVAQQKAQQQLDEARLIAAHKARMAALKAQVAQQLKEIAQKG